MYFISRSNMAMAAGEFSTNIRKTCSLPRSFASAFLRSWMSKRKAARPPLVGKSRMSSQRSAMGEKASKAAGVRSDIVRRYCASMEVPTSFENTTQIEFPSISSRL